MIYCQNIDNAPGSLTLIVPYVKKFDLSSLFSFILDGGRAVATFEETVDGGRADSEFDGYVHGGYAYMGVEYLDVSMKHKMSGKEYGWEHVEPVMEDFYFTVTLDFDEIPYRGEYNIEFSAGTNVVWTGILKITENVRDEVDFKNKNVIKIYQ